MFETVRCPTCGAPNRALLEKIRNGRARCGKCRAVLDVPREPVETNDRLFNADVLQGELPVLVDFWADWCGPCRMMAPVLDQFAVKHAGRVKVVKLDTERFPQTAAHYNIRSIPNMLLFRSGQVVRTIVGFMSLPQLENELLGWM